MKISIITINYNNVINLENTIKSVLSQSFRFFEFIIIDGGSTDGSIEVIKLYSNYFSYWISEPDTGIYNAMNKGIAKATGEYLIFLNSGDCFCDSNILQKCFNISVKQPNFDIYYGDIFVVNDKKNRAKWLRTHPESLSLDFLKNDNINHQASLIKASLFREFDFYPEYYKIASDFWFFLKCFLYKKKFKHLGFPMVDYDLTGISANNYENYRLEKQTIWRSLIPPLLEEIKRECEVNKSLVRHTKNFKIVNSAIFLYSGYQKIKKWFISY